MSTGFGIISNIIVVLTILVFPLSDFVVAEELDSTGNNPTTNEKNLQSTLTELWNQLNQSGGFAQWLIFFVLLATAITIMIQISNQTRAMKAENYFKIVERLTDNDFLESYEKIKTIFRLSPTLLQKSDSQLPLDLKIHVSKVKETYQAIGSIIYSEVVDEFLFLFAYSLNGRDAWLMLEENVTKTNEEIKKEQLVEEMYHVFFKYLGSMCLFWRSHSPYTRRYLANTRIVSVKPNSVYFIIRTYILKLFRKETPWM